MGDWNVTVTLAGHVDGDQAMAIEGKLADHEPSVGNQPDRARFTVSVTSESDYLPEAAAVAAWEVAGAVRDAGVEARLIGVEALAWTEFEARVQEPTYPDLVSAAEAAPILGVSRQRVHQLASEHDDFPPPLYELSTGKLWTRGQVKAFAEHWERRPGRPRKDNERRKAS